jgi:ribosomal protein S18 acetylase RimI-like enzyme
MYAKDIEKQGKLNIRLLSEADVDIFTPVRLRALKEDSEAFGASYEESVLVPREEMARRLRDDGSNFVYGAFMDLGDGNPTLVGTAGFLRGAALKIRHKGTVWGVYVAPEGRGQGVAKALMITIIDRIKTIDGVERIFLNVSNPSARFLYTSLGFESQSIEKGAMKIDGRYVDEELMALDLIKR